MFLNPIVLYIGIILSVVMFTALIKYFLDGKCVNVVLISIPYLIYWFMLFVVSSKIYPAYWQADNYGVGLMILLTNIYLWIDVIVASIIGTYLKRKNCYSKSRT